jgi:hypothetical protein
VGEKEEQRNMKVYVLCKHNKNCHFKQIGKRGRLWYPLCTFKGTCNQQLKVYKNTLPRLDDERPAVTAMLSNGLVVGGLHEDDLEWAAQQYEEIGYILIAFILDCDGYHWKAIYVKHSEGEPNG